MEVTSRQHEVTSRWQNVASALDENERYRALRGAISQDKNAPSNEPRHDEHSHDGGQYTAFS
jgi:hypothetical protein